jgi:8-oxo-dGTP pyrophosphatase MutT (NUDIX family)
VDPAPHEQQTANPWTRLSRRVAYENPWIRVHHDEVLNPNGNAGIYGVVEFRHRAIGIVPVDDEGCTYLVGQYRYALNLYSWEIPEGGGPLHEDAQTAAARELQEETGLVARRWDCISRLHTSNSATSEVGWIYLARDLTPGPTSPEDTEDIALRRLPLAEAVHMVMTGQITDALAIIGLLKAHLLLQSATPTGEIHWPPVV